ncbi:hypothetical protein [Arcobacter sp.]|uniref:hypothetical protein n=1 Tax=Arcobacter sp. TaxID=1872629 RepID=UPI003D0AD30A
MLNECVNIYITNMDKKSINVIQNNCDKKFQIENNIVHIEVPKPINDNSLLVELHDFIEKFKNKKKYQLTPSCVFDLDNLLLTTPNKIDFLTIKEGLFLKYLIKNNTIITYNYMNEILWNNSELSKNALRQFIKNINKKLPPRILKNIRGIEYKLNLN